MIPLPEAADLTVRLRRREAAVRVAREHTRDYTRYVVITPAGESDPLPKRRAVLHLVLALHAAGLPPGRIADHVPEGRLRPAIGIFHGDELWGAFRTQHRLTEQNRRRWFLDDPLSDGERTWVLFSNWGLNTESTLDSLVSAAPGFAYRSVG